MASNPYREARMAKQERAPRKTGSKGLIAEALPDLPLWEQFLRIGGQVTPRELSGYIRLADSGEPARLMDLANEMRQKDGHLQAVLETRETAVSGLNWELVFPNQPANSRKGSRQIKFCTEVLQAHNGLRALIAHLIGAVYYGFAVAETVWKVDNGRLVPDRFELHSPRRFKFRMWDGRLVWRDQNMPYDGVDFRQQWPDKFIVSQPRVNGDVPCREGLVRVLMWLALFRNWASADMMKLAEIAWKPWRIGKFKTGASKEDIQNLKDLLRGMTSSGAAVHGENVEIELRWPEEGASNGQGGTHDTLLKWAAAEMSKATLGQTLTTEVGETGGNRALGDVQNQMRKERLVSDAEYIGDVITRMLVEPLVRLNFGPTAPVPDFKLITDDAADLKSFSEAIVNLRNPGVALAMPAAWVRDKLGIPHPTDTDDLVGKEQGAEVADPNAEKPGEGDEGEETEPGEKPAKPEGANGEPEDSEEKPER